MPPSSRALLAFLTATALLACGDSPTETPQPPALVLSTDVVDFVRAKGDPAASTHELTVTNGGGGALSGLVASVSYELGEPTAWLTADLDATTAPATLTLSASATATDAGSFHAVVVISGGSESDTIAVSLTLELGDPPAIRITSPTRAAMLEMGTYQDTDVQITGEACHASVPITSLEVNGQALAVSGTNLCEPFTVLQSSPWGMSLIEATANNAFGRSADLVQSYLRSPSFAAPTFPPAALDSAFVAEVFAPLLDDSDSATLDDLATLAELGLGALNLRSLVPTTLYSSTILGCDLLTVTTRGISMGSFDVTLAIESAGIGSLVVGSDLVWGMRFTYTGCLGGVTTVDGLFLANSVTSSDLLDFAVVNGDLDPVITHRSMGISSPRFQFNSAAFIQAVLDAIQAQVMPVAVAQVTDEGKAYYQSMAVELRTKLHTVRKLYRQRSRELRSRRRPGGRHATRPVGAQRRYFVPGVKEGSGQGFFHGETQPALPGTGSPSFGSLLGSPPAPDMRLPDDGDIAYGVSLDVLNQLLWVAWQTGDFDDPDLAGLLGHGLTGLDVEIESRLPPVVRPGAGGATLGIDWGDVEVRATVDPAQFGLPNASLSGPISMEAHVSVRADFGLVYDGATDALVISSPTVEVRVQVVGIDAPVDEAALANAIESAVAELMDLFAEDIAAAIPTIGEVDFSNLPGLPSGFSLSFEDAVVGLQDGYVTLSGTIR